MYISSLAKTIFLAIVISGASSTLTWRSNTEDDVTSLDPEEDRFYNEEPPVFERDMGEELVEEQSAAEGPKSRIIRRQGTTGTVQVPGQVVGGLPNTGGQTQNVTSVPAQNGSTNTTTGVQPGLLGNQGNPDNEKVDCTQPQTGRSNDCWAQLGLSQYVIEWVNTHECYKGEGFSTCYLRQNGFPTLDCSGIAISSCPPPQDDSLTLDPQKFYVAYNIHGK